MADRIVTLKFLGAGSWSTTAKTVSVPNWPLEETMIVLPSSDSGIGPSGTSFEFKGTAKTPATASITFKQTRGSAGNYQDYYLSSAPGAWSFVWEDPIDGDSIMVILEALAPKIDAMHTRVTSDLPAILTNTNGIVGTLGNASTGLVAIRSAINTVDNIVDSIKESADSVKLLVDGTNGLVAIKAQVDSVLSGITNGTYGLNAIVTKTSAVQAAITVMEDALTDLSDSLALEGNLTHDIALIKSRLNILRFILNGTLFGNEQ